MMCASCDDLGTISFENFTSTIDTAHIGLLEMFGLRQDTPSKGESSLVDLFFFLL